MGGEVEGISVQIRVLRRGDPANDYGIPWILRYCIRNIISIDLTKNSVFFFITVLHGRGGYAQMITILYGGGGSLRTFISDYVICERPLMALITWTQSTTIFLSTGQFWHGDKQTNKQPTNQVNLEQACSLQSSEISFALASAQHTFHCCVICKMFWQIFVSLGKLDKKLVVMKERRSLRRRSWLSKKEDVINNPGHSHSQPAKFNEKLGNLAQSETFKKLAI